MINRRRNFFTKIIYNEKFLALIGLGLIILISFPLAKNVSKRYHLNKEIKELNKEITEFEAKNKDLKGLITYLESEQFVEEKARASDIYITSLNMAQEDKGFYWKVTIDFEANCFFRDLVKFARLLEEKKVKIVSAAIGKKVTQNKTEEGIVFKGKVEGIVIK